MSDTQEQAAGNGKKAKAEVLMVKMTDGREVGFAGKRKVVKTTLIDESKVEIDEASGILQLQAGAVSIRMDLRNGETRTYPLPLKLFPKFAGHGGEQKYGDELAAPSDKPLSEEDMVIALDDLNAEIQKGSWGKGRAAGGGGVSGASIVIRAIAEVTGKTVDEIKAYMQKRLDAEAQKPEDQRISRQALYASFRAPNSKTAPVIARMEAERAAKESKVDADAELAQIGG